MNIKIKQLPEKERPRERLINKGKESLSEIELLAIILKTGTKDTSATQLASYLLKEIKDLKNLKNITLNELLKIKGIGKAKACQILSLVELSKRINSKRETIINTKITSAEVVFEYYKNIVNSNQEGFYCVYLDPAKTVISEKLLFIGTVNQSMVHPRDIFKEAYKVNATAFICVHNHPNGDVTPSKEDLKLTKRLIEISFLMGIKLVDHVIIGENKYYSFLESGQI